MNDPKSFTPAEALDTAEEIAGMTGMPENMAIWMANLMIIVEEGATSGCTCQCCVQLALAREGIIDG